MHTDTDTQNPAFSCAAYSCDASPAAKLAAHPAAKKRFGNLIRKMLPASLRVAPWGVPNLEGKMVASPLDQGGGEDAGAAGPARRG